MAGLFGMFNYEKPGPGVDKNAPKKKKFFVFMEIFGRKFWRLMIVNLLYLLFSLPVVTHGLACAGLTYITRNFAREKPVFVWMDFIDTIKKNWKQALPVGIINLIITTVLVFNAYTYYIADGVVSTILAALSLVLLIIFSYMKYYIYMIMITFSLTIRQIYKNSLIFAFAGLKNNLVISLVCVVCYAIALLICPYMIGLLITGILAVALFPAFRSLLIQFSVFPMIQKHMIEPYYKAHPEADRKMLKTLNLTLEDLSIVDEPVDGEEAAQKAEEEKPIFQDMGRTEQPDTPARELPRQYTEKEMRRLEKKREIYRSGANDDDDDTI